MVFISVPITIILGFAYICGFKPFNQKNYKVRFKQFSFLALCYKHNSTRPKVFGAMFHQYDGFINQIFDQNTSWIGAGASYTNAMIVLMIYTVWNGLAFKIIVFFIRAFKVLINNIIRQHKSMLHQEEEFFTKITVPLLSPMILYITITSLIGAFKAYSSVISIFWHW